MTVTTYFWDELTDNVIMESDDEGNVTTYTQVPELHGKVLSQNRNGDRSTFHYDGQGNVRQVTDSTGAVTDEMTYTAFGETVSKTGSTVNPWGYKGAMGYYTNPTTEDLYVRARTLEPSLGRWLSEDPIGFVDGQNLYLYVQNSPLDNTDPSGLSPWIVSLDSMNFQNVCSADMSASFNLIIGVKDLPKPAPKQIWAINTSWGYVVDSNCNLKRMTMGLFNPKTNTKTLSDVGYQLDVWGGNMIKDFGQGVVKRVEDTHTSILGLGLQNVCLSVEFTDKTIGFNALNQNGQQITYNPPQTGLAIGPQDPKWPTIRKMRGPTGTLKTEHLYLNEKNCKACCGAIPGLASILKLITDGSGCLECFGVTGMNKNIGACRPGVAFSEGWDNLLDALPIPKPKV